MSMFGRSLALLQQTEVILTEDLNGVDLHKLRNDTASSLSEMSDATAQVWTNVLLAVSPTLFDLGRELLRVHRYMERRRKSMQVIQNIIWTLEAILIVMMVMSIGHVMKGSDKRDNTGSAVSVGIVIALGFFMFGALSSWMAVLNEMYRKIRFQQNSPINSVLLRFSDRTSRAFIVVFVSSATTGRDVRQSIAAFMKERAENDAIVKQWSNCKNSPTKSAGCEVSGMDACSLAPFYTVPEITNKIKATCRSTLVDIADALVDIADNGTSRYMRLDLWTAIDRGVQAVRKLVLTRYDDVELEAEQPKYSPDMITMIVKEELAPCLMLPGVQLSRAFSVMGNSTIMSSGMAALSGNVLDPDRIDGPDGEALCFRNCMDSKDCKVAYFHKGSERRSQVSNKGMPVCYVSTNYSAIGQSGVLEYKGVGNGDASVYVAASPSDNTNIQLCGADASDIFSRSEQDRQSVTTVYETCNYGGQSVSKPIGKYNVSDLGMSRGSIGSIRVPHGHTVTVYSSSGSKTFSTDVACINDVWNEKAISFEISKPDKTCMNGSPSELYRSSVIAASLSSTMLDQMTYLANRVLTVLRRHRFALSLDDLRPELDSALAEFYGQQVYSQAISSAVDAVLRRAYDHARNERRNPRATIDAERLLSKLEAMPSQDAGDLQRTLEDMRDASIQHRNMFPAYRNASTVLIATNALLLGTMTAVVFFTVFAYILCNMYRRPKSLGGQAISMEKLIKWMIIGLCVLVLLLFVFQTISTKVVAKSNHNADMVDHNGETLVSSSESVTRSLSTLWLLLGRSANVQSHASMSYSEVNAAKVSSPASKRLALAAMLSQSSLLIDTYDKCNSVTTGQVSTPPPYAELLMYAVVAGLFIVVTAVSMYYIAPGEKMDNIRTLNNLIARIKKGDAAAVRESESVVQCSRPPAFIWSIFVWYGVMLLAVVTIWFVMESQDVVNDYEDSLATRTDCV